MVVFLAGVHGVGKTFLGKPAAESLGFQYATASSLIRSELDDKQNWTENKRTKNVDNNQEALVASVSRIIKANKSVLILDGHFVLRSEHGDLVSLSPDLFKRLGVTSVILLEAPASIVAERLAARGAPSSLGEIEELADAERKNAQNVCDEIKAPLIKLSTPSSEQLLFALRKAVFEEL